MRAGFGLLSWLKNRPVQYLLDVSVLSAALLLAYAIRFDFHVSPETFRLALAQLPLVVLLQFGALSAFGAYAFIWKYIGLAETLVFARASVAATVPLLVMRLALPGTLQDSGTADWTDRMAAHRREPLQLVRRRRPRLGPHHW